MLWFGFRGMVVMVGGLWDCVSFAVLGLFFGVCGYLLVYWFDFMFGWGAYISVSFAVGYVWCVVSFFATVVVGFLVACL